MIQTLNLTYKPKEMSILTIVWDVHVAGVDTVVVVAAEIELKLCLKKILYYVIFEVHDSTLFLYFLKFDYMVQWLLFPID